ncbi:MAG: DUF4352 domain-containing protein, partial [Thermomicrobiales bacterium]
MMSTFSRFFRTNLRSVPSAFAPAAQEATRSDAGFTRDNPAPVGTPVDAGPLRLTVRSVVTGDDALSAILGASPMNGEPRDGIGYVLVNLAAENISQQPVHIGNDDFALVDAAGDVRRFLDVITPTPALDAFIDPGATAEGWLSFSAPVDESALVIQADPLFLDGDWADRFLALGPDTIPAAAQPPAEVNDAGRDPTAPAAPGIPVVTADWQLVLEEIVRGAAVFDLVDYRTGALKVDDATGEADGSEWVALHFTIT